MTSDSLRYSLQGITNNGVWFGRKPLCMSHSFISAFLIKEPAQFSLLTCGKKSVLFVNTYRRCGVLGPEQRSLMLDIHYRKCWHAKMIFSTINVGYVKPSLSI